MLGPSISRTILSRRFSVQPQHKMSEKLCSAASLDRRRQWKVWKTFRSDLQMMGFRWRKREELFLGEFEGRGRGSVFRSENTRKGGLLNRKNSFVLKTTAALNMPPRLHCTSTFATSTLRNEKWKKSYFYLSFTATALYNVHLKNELVYNQYIFHKFNKNCRLQKRP